MYFFYRKISRFQIESAVIDHSSHCQCRPRHQCRRRYQRLLAALLPAGLLCISCRSFDSCLRYQPTYINCRDWSFGYFEHEVLLERRSPSWYSWWVSDIAYCLVPFFWQHTQMVQTLRSLKRLARITFVSNATQYLVSRCSHSFIVFFGHLTP